MTAPAKSIPSDSVKEGVFRFLKDFREGYDATSFGVYYQAFSLMQDARNMEDVGHIAEVRFYRDPTGRIDGLELVRLTPKAPKLRIEVVDRRDCPKCGNDADATGFCAKCTAEIEADIGLDDVERPEALPRPNYGSIVDPFGGF